jgi:ATP-dependent Clp protease ATP-binding subunit ClpA
VYFATVLSTFERYTDAAKRAIYFARLEANHRDADSITPEHILAGLTWESDSTFAGIAPLKEHTLTLRAQLELPHLPSTSIPYLRDCNIPLNDGGKMALAYAVEEANRDRQYWITCDHLLRGLLRFRNTANHALRETGINLQAVRSAAKLHRRSHPSNPAPKWGYLKLAIDRSRPVLVWLAFLVLMLALVLVVRLRGPV